jgi:hypothetical protein
MLHGRGQTYITYEYIDSAFSFLRSQHLARQTERPKKDHQTSRASDDIFGFKDTCRLSVESFAVF